MNFGNRDSLPDLGRDRSRLLQPIPDGYAILGPHGTVNQSKENIHTRSNIYILIEENEAILLDTGFGVRFRDKLNRIIRSLSLNLRSIILTHLHYDHVGAAQVLADNFGSTIMAHENDVPYIEDPHSISTSGLSNADFDRLKRKGGEEKLISNDEINSLYPERTSVNRS